MNVYLAARYDRMPEMVEVAEQLRRIGHEVTSRWIRGFGNPDAETALYDLTDIVIADAIILFTEDPTANVPFAARGGRHVEFGYALRAGKKLYLVGPRENIFHELPDVLAFEDVDEMLHHFTNCEAAGEGAWD